MLVGVQDEKCLNCGRWNPGMWGFAPALTRLGRDLGFVPFVITSCVVLYIASVIVDFHPGGDLLSLFSPTLRSLRAFGASGVYPVLIDGMWWTVLTASWLHGNPIHILMNMMSLRNVAPIVAEFYGASRMIIIYVLSGVAGFTASTLGSAYLRLPFLGGSGFTVGASASIAGLIGAVFYYGHRTGTRHIADQAKLWIMMFLIMGVAFRGIDNWAHIGGLAGGYACSKFLDPLHPERLDHFLIAIGLLIASAIAILFSVVHAWLFLRYA
jgi:rhomboid protease GluP